jgi:hypothetical protein
MVKLRGFGDIEIKKISFMKDGSIVRLNQVIGILESLEPTKEIKDCIQLLEEIKKIEEID